MEFISIHDLTFAAIAAAKVYFEINGALATAIIQQALLPFHEFNTTTVLSSVGAMAILWHKRSWIFSGLSHILHIAEWLLIIFRKPWGL